MSPTETQAYCEQLVMEQLIERPAEEIVADEPCAARHQEVTASRR